MGVVIYVVFVELSVSVSCYCACCQRAQHQTRRDEMVKLKHGYARARAGGYIYF
jgi:hypothetical protein